MKSAVVLALAGSTLAFGTNNEARHFPYPLPGFPGLPAGTGMSNLPFPTGVGGFPAPTGGMFPAPTGGMFPAPTGGMFPAPTGGMFPAPTGGMFPKPRFPHHGRKNLTIDYQLAQKKQEDGVSALPSFSLADPSGEAPGALPTGQPESPGAPYAPFPMPTGGLPMLPQGPDAPGAPMPTNGFPMPPQAPEAPGLGSPFPMPPHAPEAPGAPEAPEVPLPTPGVPLSPDTPFPMPTGGFPMPTGGFPMPTGGFPMPTGGFPMPTGGFPMPTGGLPMPTGGFPSLPTTLATMTRGPQPTAAPPFSEGEDEEEGGRKYGGKGAFLRWLSALFGRKSELSA